VRYTDARAVSSWTWPSTASLFTGLQPIHHGVVDLERAYLGDAMETMGLVFGAGGYTTGAFVANQLIMPENNFDHGFETFVNTPSGRARPLNERLLHWLDNHEGLASRPTRGPRDWWLEELGYLDR
jgi:arylsulfatase A-like enzyme